MWSVDWVVVRGSATVWSAAVRSSPVVDGVVTVWATVWVCAVWWSATVATVCSPVVDGSVRWWWVMDSMVLDSKV